LGAQQMVDILTNKNLLFEDQVRELQETVDNLVSRSYFYFYNLLFFVLKKESLCEMDKGKNKGSVV
jgi:hypothetical protein